MALYPYIPYGKITLFRVTLENAKPHLFSVFFLFCRQAERFRAQMFRSAATPYIRTRRTTVPTSSSHGLNGTLLTAQRYVSSANRTTPYKRCDASLQQRLQLIFGPQGQSLHNSPFWGFLPELDRCRAFLKTFSAEITLLKACYDCKIFVSETTTQYLSFQPTELKTQPVFFIAKIERRRNMLLLPWSGNERLYFYRQSQQLAG